MAVAGIIGTEQGLFLVLEDVMIAVRPFWLEPLD